MLNGGSYITPGLHATSFNQPKDWQAFERLIRDLAAKQFDDPNADLHGRSGQSQNGVDIVCRTASGELLGIQCKHLRDGASPVRMDAMLAAEVERAKSFDPPLQRFILITNTTNDVELQAAARRATEANATQGLFSVNVHGWDWVESLLSRWPDIAVQYALISQPSSTASGSSVAAAIGARFGRVIELINAERAKDDAIGVTDIAGALSHLDWRELEALAQGQYAGNLDQLERLAKGLGVCSEWLIHGRAAPFQTDLGPGDAKQQGDAILALNPKRVVVFRSRSEPFSAAIAVRDTALRWTVFDSHPCGPEVGGTGRHQLFEFACLLRRLFKALFQRDVAFVGRQLDGEAYQALMDGEAYPGSVLRMAHNDPWWQDFCQFDAPLVEGDQPEAIALRDAIAIAEGVLAEYWSAASKTAWKRERLMEAGLPLEKPAEPGPLLVDLGLEKKAPAAARRATSWPRIAALKLDEVRFTFSASSDRVLLGGGCHIDVRSTAKVPLTSCGVFVVAVQDGHERTEVGAYLRSGRQGADGGGFSLGAGQMKRLHLCTRDLKDIISRPPWLIHLEGQDLPLFDGDRWFVDLELRSDYEHPTKVRLALDVDHGKAVGAAIMDQAV